MVSVFFDADYLPVVVGLIRQATRSIVACCYEWVWYSGQRSGTIQDVNRELCSAARRGVPVRVLLHREAPGRPLSRHNRLTGHNLARYGVDVRFAGTARIHHAKFWVFDGATVVISTHNVSQRAVRSNAELGVVVGEPGEVARVAAYFEGLWNAVPGVLDGAERQGLDVGP